MKTYNTILFDWDGCLAKTLEVWLKAYKDTFAKYDIELSDQVIATQVFGDWRGAEKQGVQDLEGFNEQLMAKVNHDIKKVSLYDGVKDLLTSIKKTDRKIALLSSSVREFIEPALANHDLDGIFDVLLDGNDVEKHKPDPEVLNKAIKTLNANVSTTIMVGDSKSDLGAAKAANVDSMLFYPDSHKLFYDKNVLMSYKPTFVVSNFDDARKILINERKNQ